MKKKHRVVVFVDVEGGNGRPALPRALSAARCTKPAPRGFPLPGAAVTAADVPEAAAPAADEEEEDEACAVISAGVGVELVTCMRMAVDPIVTSTVPAVPAPPLSANTSSSPSASSPSSRTSVSPW